MVMDMTKVVSRVQNILFAEKYIKTNGVIPF